MTEDGLWKFEDSTNCSVLDQLSVLGSLSPVNGPPTSDFSHAPADRPFHNLPV
jgi:hypothetical protein